MEHATDFRLLQAEADEEAESDFRILVDAKFVEYLTIDPGSYDARTMCFGPTLFSALPPLPPGDWNQGHISINPRDGRPHFMGEKVQLPQIMHIWHPLKVDHLDLEWGEKLRSNVYEATIPGTVKTTVIVEFARFAWEIPLLDAETTAYQWLQGHSIGPEFLGHLVEGRVIGFILEQIPNFRHATPEDLPLCQQALSKLHQIGIKHGDINKHNFLVHDGKTTLIDFDVATRCNDTKTLTEEFERLQQELEDVSGRGGMLPVETSWMMPPVASEALSRVQRKPVTGVGEEKVGLGIPR